VEQVIPGVGFALAAVILLVLPLCVNLQTKGSAAPSGLGARRTQVAAAGNSPSGPGGAWETPGPNGTIRLVLNPDGTGTLGGGAVRWQFNQGILSLAGPNGTTVMYNAALTENSLTVSGGNLAQPVVFSHVASEANSAGSKFVGKTGGDGLVGRWQGPAGIVEIKADGMMVIPGVNYRYKVQGNTLTLTGNDGTLPVPFRLDGETLTLTLSGQSATLKRMAAEAASPGTGAGGIAPELVGKWCYFSSFTDAVLSPATSGRPGAEMIDAGISCHLRWPKIRSCTGAWWSQGENIAIWCVAKLDTYTARRVCLPKPGLNWWKVRPRAVGARRAVPLRAWCSDLGVKTSDALRSGICDALH